MSNGTALVNIIAHCSALCNSDNSTDHIQFKLEVAILSLKQYVSTQSQLNDQSKIHLIKFLIEQLQLLHVFKQARRY